RYAAHCVRIETNVIVEVVRDLVEAVGETEDLRQPTSHPEPGSVTLFHLCRLLHGEVPHELDLGGYGSRVSQKEILRLLRIRKDVNQPGLLVLSSKPLRLGLPGRFG